MLDIVNNPVQKQSTNN